MRNTHNPRSLSFNCINRMGELSSTRCGQHRGVTLKGVVGWVCTGGAGEGLGGGPHRGQRWPFHGWNGLLPYASLLAVNCVCNLLTLKAILEMSPQAPQMHKPLGRKHVLRAPGGKDEQVNGGTPPTAKSLPGKETHEIA